MITIHRLLYTALHDKKDMIESMENSSVIPHNENHEKLLTAFRKEHDELQAALDELDKQFALQLCIDEHLAELTKVDTGELIVHQALNFGRILEKQCPGVLEVLEDDK